RTSSPWTASRPSWTTGASAGPAAARWPPASPCSTRTPARACPGVPREDADRADVEHRPSVAPVRRAVRRDRVAHLPVGAHGAGPHRVGAPGGAGLPRVRGGAGSGVVLDGRQPGPRRRLHLGPADRGRHGSRSGRGCGMRAKTVLPAVAMTAVSMVLTLAVVVMWLGTAVPWPVALVVGLGIDGGWLATLAYERRLAAQGDHNRAVTAVGWSFGILAAGVLVAHALTAEHSAGAWLAVAWLPIAAKALWLVHAMWERTALTPVALPAIRGIQQEARDEAAVARARLRAEAATEETRLTAVTEAGARVARVQAKTAQTLSSAWSTLETARAGEETGRALTSVTARVTPGVT